MYYYRATFQATLCSLPCRVPIHHHHHVCVLCSALLPPSSSIYGRCPAAETMRRAGVVHRYAASIICNNANRISHYIVDERCLWGVYIYVDCIHCTRLKIMWACECGLVRSGTVFLFFHFIPFWFCTFVACAQSLHIYTYGETSCVNADDDVDRMSTFGYFAFEFRSTMRNNRDDNHSILPGCGHSSYYSNAYTYTFSLVICNKIKPCKSNKLYCKCSKFVYILYSVENSLTAHGHRPNLVI